MFGLIYLAGAILAGDGISSLFLPEAKTNDRYGIWVRLASAFGTGVLVVTWMVYFAAWGFFRLGGVREPLRPANLLVLGVVFAWAAGKFIASRKRRRPFFRREGILFPEKSWIVFFVILLAFSAFLMFYTFHVSGHTLFSGFTVFSDYAPHTAMIRSFSHENNYPTQYPHFGGEDVKYHFMFQFLTGNLEYLGMRIDYAYNMVSLLSLALFVMMLAVMAAKLGGGLKGAVLASGFFFFRSGLAFFRFAFEHLQAGDLWETLRTNTSFIGYTPNENWGLWCLNVYLNQRHLAFGLLIGSIAVWTCLTWLEESSKDDNTAGEDRPVHGEMFRLLLTREAWQWQSPEKALLVGWLLGMTAFWNGAAVIGVLLILAGFALFGVHKLDYVLLAFAAVISSFLQSRIFIRGNAISPVWNFGFIAENKTLPGILWFLLEISGIYFFGILLAAVLYRSLVSKLVWSFFLPVIFAFCCSLTPDINVNHKYIMVSYAFMAVVWGALLGKLLGRLNRRAWLARGGMILLIVSLMLTGGYDFVVILKDNGPGHEVGVDLDSGLTEWLNENLDTDDLLLTPQYSMNDVTVSGVMMYCGWPYYAWSAGYDTYYRAHQQQLIYSTYQVSTLKDLVSEEGITYILYEDGMTIEGMEAREDTIARAYPLVFDYGYIRIYEVDG